MIVMQITEHCFFFPENDDQYLYGCSYLPVGKTSEIGVVIVPPVGHERLRCYRESVNLARDLARAGYAVLRFDYRGEGESYGSIENTDVSTRLVDIQTAIIELSKRTKISKLCLLGFRIGAVFCLQIAEKLQIKRLILCEPVLDTKGYVKNLIRANIIMQRDYFGKINKTEEGIRKDLEAGSPVSVYGFHLNRNHIQQLEEIDMLSSAMKYTGKALIIYFALGERPPKPNLLKLKNAIDAHGSCEISCLVNHFSWITKKVWIPFLEGLNQRIATWLEAQE